MQERRLNKFREVADRRQPDLTVILENVTDPHNIGAVIRTCDAIGIGEVFILNTEPLLKTPNIVIGRRTSMGSKKWVHVRYFTDADACFEKVRASYGRIMGTCVDPNAQDLFSMNLTEPTALLFGNEHSGVSAVSQSNMDGSFYIPQMGMTESLNISVACAVTLYEALRQRRNAGFYKPPFRTSPEKREALFQSYVNRHQEPAPSHWIIPVENDKNHSTK